MSTENPLSKLYRNKNVFIKLPSEGKYYSDIKLSVDGELGVMPMTAKDEIVLKTPDSLFNGESLKTVFESCVPDIKNPNEVPACDIDPIILGIRAATKNELDMSITCPSCKSENTFEFNIIDMLSKIKKQEYSNILELYDETKIHLRPYSLENLMKLKLKEFNYAKMQKHIKTIVNNSNNSEEIGEQLKTEFASIFHEITDLTMEIVSNCITKVEIKNDNDENPLEITDYAHIKEWVKNMDNSTYKNISNRINELNNDGLDRTVNVVCPNCNHNFKTELEINPVNFFI